MASKVYCALLEVLPLPGCDLDPATVAGAIARCYVVADDSTEALKKCAGALKDDLFELVNVEWCVADDEVDWDDPENEAGEAHVREARESGEVIYGGFHTWSTNAVAD